MTLTDIAAVVVGLLLGIPAAVLALEVALGGVRRPRCLTPVDVTRPGLAVLIPAHNEASGIADTVASVREQLHPGDRLIVVADNCQDDTAACARAAGAEVFERHEPQKRGKGYALATGVALLAKRPPSLVVMIDADCKLESGCLEALASAAVSLNTAVQAVYLMRNGAGAGIGQRFSEFAWRVKNDLRPRGAARLGWPCQLTGSGMAFPWAALQGVPLASGNIVEDMQLGIDLALAGRYPRLVSRARVTSAFPLEASARASQRRRWEHGHLGTLWTQVPRLIGRAVGRRDSRLLGMALDIAVPPLALLVLAAGMALVLGLVLWWSGQTSSLAAVGATVLLVVASAVVLAWRARGRDLVSLPELVFAPVYVLRKLPLYMLFFIRRQTTWVRAKRDGE